MAKAYYCANCGKRLNIALKAIPKHAMIVSLVEYHECSEEVQEFDPAPMDSPTYVPELDKDHNKFVQKLNDLRSEPSTHVQSGGDSTVEMMHKQSREFDLKDRRPTNQVKSTAPSALVDQLHNLQHTTPVHDVGEEPDEKDT